jgi:hypothetical protein
MEILITSLTSIIGTVLAAVVPLLITNKKLKARLESAPIVARGLAVGYLENFLKPINSIMTGTMIMVEFDDSEERIGKEPSTNKRKHTFPKSCVEIILIHPAKLSAASITNSIKSATLPEANILRPGSNRGFKINYDIIDRAGDKILLIQDLVKPMFAIKHYAESYLGLSEDSADWNNMEKLSLGEFKDTVEHLRTKGEGVGIDQIAWKAIG